MVYFIFLLTRKPIPRAHGALHDNYRNHSSISYKLWEVESLPPDGIKNGLRPFSLLLSSFSKMCLILRIFSPNTWIMYLNTVDCSTDIKILFIFGLFMMAKYFNSLPTRPFLIHISYYYYLYTHIYDIYIFDIYCCI